VRTLINVEDGATAAGATGDAYATSHEADSTAHTAAEIVNTPAGGIAATDVQAALNELDGDKVAGPASATDNSIARFDGTTGKLIQDGGGATLSDNGHLQLLASDAGLHLQERVTGPASQAATGHYWVKAGALPKPIYTDDVGTESELIGSAIAGQIAALTLVSAATGDHILIEDSSDSNNKKRIVADDVLTNATTVNAAGAIMHSDISPSDGILYKSASETYTAIKCNLAGTAAPTVNEDSGDGYSIGSEWLDTTNDKTYKCTDATLGAAVWKQTSNEAGGSGDVVGPGSATDNAIARFDSTTGKLIQDSANSTLGDQSGLVLAGTDAHVEMAERASAPTDAAGKGYWWVKDAAPTLPMFTDDTSNDLVCTNGFTFNWSTTLDSDDTANWIGISQTDPGSTMVDTYGASSGDPSLDTVYSRIPIVPYNGILVAAQMWVRWGGNSPDGTFEVWRFRFTSGSSSYTATKIMDVATVTNADNDTTVVYDYKNLAGTGTVQRGDGVVLLWKATDAGGGATSYVRGSWTISETL
jgi:hypothetical protein